MKLPLLRGDLMRRFTSMIWKLNEEFKILKVLALIHGILFLRKNAKVGRMVGSDIVRARCNPCLKKENLVLTNMYPDYVA